MQQIISDPFNIYNSTTQYFDLSHGFLPAVAPMQHLLSVNIAWENTARELAKFLVTGKIRSVIEKLTPFEVSQLLTKAECERAMLILSYLGHAYVWGQYEPVDRLPENLAMAWYEIAKRVGRPPVLSYASYALYNWRKIDEQKPIELGNIVLLQNFLGGIDEEWFILVHVDIEAKAIPGLLALIPAQDAVLKNDIGALIKYLKILSTSLIAMCHTLDRMPEHCDPYIYYNRVRPYIHGWKNNPVLPQGLLYVGVSAYENKPQKFKGETGAQSSIIPAFDAALGIKHEDNPLKTHLSEMRDYMPTPHRLFIESLEKNTSIREYVLQHAKQNTILRDSYNDCIRLISQFRSTHFKYAAQYIQKQCQTSTANPIDIGTGGTPFMEYLRIHKQETEKYLI